MSSSIDSGVIQTIRENFPAVRRISELPDTDSLTNKDDIESESYVVLANASKQQNYKKKITNIKSEIRKEVVNDIKEKLNYDIDNDYDKRIKNLEDAVTELQTNGGGSGGGTTPTPSGKSIIYYLWFIDSQHKNTYISETSKLLYSTLKDKEADNAVNACPFKSSTMYSVYSIIQEKFGSFESSGNNPLMIIPKQFIELDSDNYLYVNNQILTTSGFAFKIHSIDSKYYQLQGDSNNIEYAIVQLQGNNVITTGLKLKLS